MDNTIRIKEILIQSIFEVLEKMFFVFAEPLPARNIPYDMRASISFSGSVQGEMQLCVSRALAKIMAMNMLNIDEHEADEPVVTDCVKEALNMICGNFLRKIDVRRVFQLTIPTCDSIRKGEDISAGRDVSLRLIFAADGEGFEILLLAPGLMQ